jgi:hypothetical protein
MSKFKIVLAVLAGSALTGCTVQNLPNGGVALQTLPLNQFLAGGISSRPQTSASFGTPASANRGNSLFPSIIGHSRSYAGSLEGGAGTLSVTNAGQGRYHIGLDLSGSQGGGSVSGFAYRQADGSLHMTQGYAGDIRASCDLTFTPDDGRVGIMENNCMTFHGASVSFSGTLSPNP